MRWPPNQRSRREVGVGHLETLLFLARPNERTNDPDPGDLFAQHPVDAIDLHLHRLEERHRQRQHNDDNDSHQRHDHHQHEREGYVLVEGHDHAADAHDGGDHQDRERHLQEQLELLDIVGIARDQGCRAEVVHVARREQLHFLEERIAEVTAHSHGDARCPIHGDDRDNPQPHRDAEHDAAGSPDVVDVAFDNSVVDDVGVEIG